VSVYFDSAVFLAVLNGEPTSQDIRELLRQLQKRKTRIVTSIVTVQEVSVASYKKGQIATDNHVKVNKLARIEGVTRDIALTSAKLEAQILDKMAGADKFERQKDNKRRKWDCFHIATAMCLKCETLYTVDDEMLRRKNLLGITGIDFCLPKPDQLLLLSVSEESNARSQ